MKKVPWLSLILAIIHTSTGLVILIFSSWFIAACALVPMNFNYMLPAVVIRALALIRIGSGYGHMWLAHNDLLARTASLRSALFGRLKDTFLLKRAGDTERLATHTENISSVWVGWVAHQASACVLVLMSVWVATQMALPGLTAIWITACVWAALTTWLVIYGLKTAAKRTREEETFRHESEHFLASSSLWHLRVKPNQQRFRHAPRLTRVWSTHLALEKAGQWALWALQGIALVLLSWVILNTDNEALGKPAAIIVPMLLLSVVDWLGRPIATAAHIGHYRESYRALERTETQALPSVVKGVPVESVALKRFQAETLNHGVSAQLPAKGLVLMTGPSGSGKSSLLSALAGLKPARGELQFDGKAVPAGRREGWVYVEQTPRLLEATLRMNLVPDGRKVNDDTLRGALARFGLSTLADDLDMWLGTGGRALSGGEARRLTLARTYLAGATVWLVDEPFEGLDEPRQNAIAEALLGEASESLVIIASHVVPVILQSQSITAINLTVDKP